MNQSGEGGGGWVRFFFFKEKSIQEVKEQKC